ncbi:hypothetical protein [Rhodobacter maris]|uniref:Uncharacterized protein n=1 Tax=Rhodobacter maris TaxID=446682 RepID=A0A285RF58_9RHOB|nr:hypothetical protein [Rhodobacter maris]SOB92743.1 hypothetical protein SAMN05877831_10152 [Rhodobacter maris]
MKDLDLSASLALSAGHRMPWQSALLRMLRLIIDSYRAPDRDGWSRSLRLAQVHWGEDRGALVFSDLARVLEEMRKARHSPFGFGAAQGEAATHGPTRHEALFLQTIRLQYAGLGAQADAVAHLLCECNETAAYLAAVRKLAHRLR